MFLGTSRSFEPSIRWPGGEKRQSPFPTRISARNADSCNIVFFDGHVENVQLVNLFDSSGKNITTSPVIWDPLNPDAP
jgi:prepilin-type processing-associated H-X9-DG protein